MLGLFYNVNTSANPGSTDPTSGWSIDLNCYKAETPGDRCYSSSSYGTVALADSTDANRVGADITIDLVDTGGGTSQKVNEFALNVLPGFTLPDVTNTNRSYVFKVKISDSGGDEYLAADYVVDSSPTGLNPQLKVFDLSSRIGEFEPLNATIYLVDEKTCTKTTGKITDCADFYNIDPGLFNYSTSVPVDDGNGSTTLADAKALVHIGACGGGSSAEGDALCVPGGSGGDSIWVFGTNGGGGIGPSGDPVTEPGTLLLFSLPLAGFLIRRRRIANKV